MCSIYFLTKLIFHITNDNFGLATTVLGLVLHLSYCSNTGEGSNLDYTLGHPFVRALFESSTPDEVVATFRVDSIALEPDETFSLELVPLNGVTLPSGDGVFFVNVMNVTIIDHDSEFWTKLASTYNTTVQILHMIMS